MKRSWFTRREGGIGHLSLRFHVRADSDSSCHSRLELLSIKENCKITVTCAGRHWASVLYGPGDGAATGSGPHLACWKLGARQSGVARWGGEVGRRDGAARTERQTLMCSEVEHRGGAARWSCEDGEANLGGEVERRGETTRWSSEDGEASLCGEVRL
jgi:hypothetical protein